VEQLARIADEFGGGKGHLTTRQNIQYHFVPLARVPDLMHLLADAGLTNREACYNTVRNVTTCPWAASPTTKFSTCGRTRSAWPTRFLRKDLTSNLPRKFKIAFDGCRPRLHSGAINDIGLRAAIRDGRRGFRMIVGGGLGPLPTEAQTARRVRARRAPAEQVRSRHPRVQQIRQSQQQEHGALKFVLRERGFDWLREQIEKEYADILANGGIAWPEMVPEGFGGYQSHPQPLGNGALLPVVTPTATGVRRIRRVAESNVRATADRLRGGHGARGAGQPDRRPVARRWRGSPPPPAMDWCASPSTRTWCWGSFRWRGCARARGAQRAAGLGESGARGDSRCDHLPRRLLLQPGAHQVHEPGRRAGETVRRYDDPQVRGFPSRPAAARTPAATTGSATSDSTATRARSMAARCRTTRCCWAAGIDEEGIMRFGLAVQSIPARLAPEAVTRVLDHFIANRQEGETFRQYVTAPQGRRPSAR
jgi:hypothetical protein